MPCRAVTASPKRLPTDSWIRVAGTATITASFAARKNNSTLRPRNKCQQDTPNITIEQKINAAWIVCKYAISENSFDSNTLTLVNCDLHFTVAYHSGCCILEFPVRIQYISY